MDLEEEYVLKVKSTVEDLVAERGLSHLPVEVKNSRWRGDNSHTHDQLAVELHQAALARTPLPDPDREADDRARPEDDVRLRVEPAARAVALAALLRASASSAARRSSALQRPMPTIARQPTIERT